MAERRLVLIRHAKAAQGQIDLERPLTERGGHDAGAVGSWLSSRGIAPDRVVISPSRRTRETWVAVAGVLRSAPEPVVDDRIYGNSIDDLLDIIRETPAEVNTLVLVGHNPSIGTLAYELNDDTGDADARHTLSKKGYPTSATSVYTFTRPWSDIDFGTGTLAAFGALRG